MRRNILTSGFNKKGNIPDILNQLYFWVYLVVIIIIMSLVLYQFNSKVQGMTQSVVEPAKDTLNTYTSLMMATLDWGSVLIFLVFNFFIIYSAHQIDASPMNLVFGVILYVAQFYLYPVLANIIIKVFNATPETQLMELLLPKTAFIVENLVLITLILGALAVWALYSKPSSGVTDI